MVEAGVVSFDRKIWNIGHVGELGIYQENAQNPNASYAIKKGTQHNSALRSQ